MNRAFLRVATALAVAASTAGSVAAQTAPAPSGAPDPATALSIESAVATTLARDPEVASAAERLAQQRAALDEARGIYDRRVVFRGAVDLKVAEPSSSRLKQEKNTRLRLEIPPPEFDTVSKQLIGLLPVAAGDDAARSLLFPDCTQATTFFVLRDPSTEAVQSVLCFDRNDNLLGILGAPGGDDQLNAFNLAGLFDDFSQIDPRLDAFVKANLALVADEMRLIALALRQAAAALRFQRLRLGDLPETQELNQLTLGLDWQHRFKGGSAFVGSIEMLSNEDNYKGKRLSPAFGDSTIPNTFNVSAGLALEIPLGRGAGAESFGAPVKAAEENVAAAEALYRHVASERVLQTLEAYWTAASAAQRLALLNDSLATQDRIFAATEELVAADVLPRVDLSRGRARRAEVASQVAAARQALAVARVQLQKAIGLEASTLEVAPYASEGFGGALGAELLPAQDPGESAEALVSRAYAARRDLAAARSIVAANRVLVGAAKRDLRPDVALSLNVSFSAFHESYTDRFYDFEGFLRAVEDQIAGPSYGAALRYRFPIGNRSAKGALLANEAAASQSQINAGDLERTISLTVRELVRTLADSKAELASRREALARLEETHAASVERHKAGDLSLIDTLATEEQLTAARLAVVDAERRLLSIQTRLRFETGALLDQPPGEGSAARLRPLTEPLL